MGKFTVPAPAPSPTITNEASSKEDSDEKMDENSPLWKAVLKIANGDREAAEKMIIDPDSLSKYPEINAILEAERDDLMDTGATAGSTADEQLAKDMDNKMQIDDSPSPDLQRADTGQEDTVVDLSSVKEGDPREHLNLVF